MGEYQLNMEKINRDDFDFLGIIKLKDAAGIEQFVTPMKNGYLSRNSSYYQSRSCEDLSKERADCNNLLPARGKKAFVIAERMLNTSCRVYYNEFKKHLKNKNNQSNYLSAKRCLDEDVERVISAMKNFRIKASKLILPCSKDIAEGRPIEADNKIILLESIEKLNKVNYIISPLLGGILIGPFFKALHKTGYSHTLFGMHDQKCDKLIENDAIKDVNKVMLACDLINLPQRFAIFDDNIGTGKTTQFLKNTFKKMGKKSAIGSLEVSWEYFDQVRRGIRKEEIFDPAKIDFKTFRSTRHHTLSDIFISALKKSGVGYLKKLKRYGYQNQFVSDTDLLFNRGRTICKRYNLDVDSYINYHSNFILSVDIMNQKIRYLNHLPVTEAIKFVQDFETVNVIDLDRYRGRKANLSIIKKILAIKKCRVGGGLKTRKDIQQLLDLGAQKVIVGTHASEELFKYFPQNRIIVALDSTCRETGEKRDIPALIKRFEPYCDEVQYVCVETDGKALGGDIRNAIQYSKLTKNKLNCIGGIASKKELLELEKHKIGCGVGRAIEERYYG
jgi:phosphoribosylformimino-5-aminoimidazole carboxamide ribonucleotide (ProFAR) isomerase